MPSPPFSKNELPLIRKPSSPLSTNTPAKPLKAMTLPSPAPVPPIVSGPSETWSPNRPLPTAIVPLGSVPTRLPWMTLFFVKAPSKTPSNVLPEMTLPAPAAEPPMVRTRESLPAPKLAMPIWFGSATVPVLSVPMRFPWIVAAIDEFRLAATAMPTLLLPEITFRASGVGPPAVKLRPPFWTNMLIPDEAPRAMVPVASVPMKFPSMRVVLPDSRSMASEWHPLMTRPRIVTVPGANTTRQWEELDPSSSISGTALIAPVAFVFGWEPVCM